MSLDAGFFWPLFELVDQDVDDYGNKEQNTLTVYLSALRKHSMKWYTL